MRILNFGSLNIDYVYAVDAFLRPGETKAAKSLMKCTGITPLLSNVNHFTLKRRKKQRSKML